MSLAERIRSTSIAVATEEHEIMAMRLNRQAFEHAKDLITKGMFVTDQRDAWSEHPEHQPSAADENDFIRKHGYDEFGKWHLWAQ